MAANKKLGLLALALIFLSMTAIPTTRVAAQGGTQAQGNPAFISAQEVVNITASPRYTILSLNAISDISSSLNLNFSGFVNGTPIPNLILSSSTQIEIQTSFSPSEILAYATVNNSLVPLQIVILATQSTGFKGYMITIPSGANSSTITIQGQETGEYLIGRYVTDIPVVALSSLSGIGVDSHIQTNLFLPQSSIIYGAYGEGNAGAAGPSEPVPPSTGAQSGEVRYGIPATVATLVIQSDLFVPLSIVITALAIILIAFTVIGFFSFGIRLINRIFVWTKSTIRGVATRISELLHIHLRRKPGLGFPWREMFKSKNLLVFFILCGVLMISFAALAGPDPAIHAYVVAPPQEVSQIQTELQASSPAQIQVVTPSQDYTDFNVMSSVGMFKVLVVSDYSSAGLAEIHGFILQDINNVPIIALTPTADPSFVAQIRAVYSGQIVNITNTGVLTSAIGQQLPTNALGLQISNSSFKIVLIIEAGLSFLIVLLGWAYLGAKAAEPADEKSLTSMAFVILTGVFVFYFAEVAYIATSATLNFPLSLHAVLSGAETITAVGAFGVAVHLPLGGGSTPRLAVGVLGILIGGFGAAQGKTFSKRAVGLIVGVSVVLLANPLQLGGAIFQGVLLFIGNTQLGFAFTSALTLKGFLYGIGSALGGTISPTYVMSAGTILYFSGLVPLALMRKMSRGTATLALIFGAVISGDGGVRVGQMTPDQTVIAVLPGLIAGVIFTIVLLLISWIERYLTTAYVRSRP